MKFIKIALLFIVIVSLVACSSSVNTKPEDVRDEIWVAMNTIYDEVVSFYQDGNSLNRELLEKNGLIYMEFRRDDTLTNSEKLLLEQLTTLSAHTVMIDNGDSVETLKDLLSYDFDLELEVSKQLLKR